MVSKKMEKSIEKYKQVFQEREIPRWTGIAAAFSYVLALLQDKSDRKHFVRKGQIDITTPLDRYDVPDCSEILKMQSTKTDDKLNGDDIIWAAHSLLISKLSKGDIKCQGQLQETFRVAITSCNPPHEYYKGKDETDPPSDFMVINQAEWQNEPIIDYKRQCFTKWQENPGDIDEYGDPDSKAAFFVTGFFPGDAFCWKIDCINLQVNSEDLIRSTEKLFNEYYERNNTRTLEHDSWSKIMAPSGINRFFFSKITNSWVIEFKGKPFQFYFGNKTSKKARTIQYLLKHGGQDIDDAMLWCNWCFLDEIGAFHIVFSEEIRKKEHNHGGTKDDTETSEERSLPDEYEISGFANSDKDGISVQDMPMKGYEAISKEDIKIFREQFTNLKRKIKNPKSKKIKKKYQDDLKALEKHFLSYFHKGKIKIIDEVLDTIKKRVRKRRDDFKNDLKAEFQVKDDNGMVIKEISGPHRDLYYHLHDKKNVVDIDVGFAYMCNKKWITEESQA